MRKRFKLSMVCSSDHYFESKKAHRAYIEECHKTFVELDIQVVIKHRYYVKVFGDLMEISEERALRMQSNGITIIIK